MEHLSPNRKSLNEKQQQGYSLFELLVVVIIIGIIASVSFRSMKTTNDVARSEQTIAELDKLSFAMAGNPELVSGGSRTDFGYVGDVGSLPINLDGLTQNPGGYSTWNGPYIRDEFSSASGTYSEYKFDAWGAPYSYSGSVSISSTGGGTTITREFAHSVEALLYNPISIDIVDLNHSLPGPTYRDSIIFTLTYPDGIGGISGSSKQPRADGYLSFDSIPVGLHLLRIVYLPDADTTWRRIAVNPGSQTQISIRWHKEVW